MIPLSILDLSPIPEGADAGQALRNSADLARHAEALGYRRYWMAEHHNMPGIASAATAVALAHVAAGTSTIRLGAGGIMLPNHAPLMVAEQFGTLAALHPGRIDLGLGRAPGSDQVAARAMRRNLGGDVDDFPRDVMELMRYFEPAQPGQQLQAVPGAGLDVPVWILGSSTYGAQLAAALGLPYAFASHFAPTQMMEAMEIYRGRLPPLGRGSPRRMSCSASTSSPPIPMPRRAACSPRTSSPSSTSAAAARASCPARSTTWRPGWTRMAAPCWSIRSPAPIVGGPETVRQRPRRLRQRDRRRRADGHRPDPRPRRPQAVL